MLMLLAFRGSAAAREEQLHGRDEFQNEFAGTRAGRKPFPCCMSGVKRKRNALMLLVTLADLNLFNGAILFQCADILMHILQLISEKLSKHRIHGTFLLSEMA